MFRGAPRGFQGGPGGAQETAWALPRTLPELSGAQGVQKLIDNLTDCRAHCKEGAAPPLDPLFQANTHTVKQKMFFYLTPALTTTTTTTPPLAAAAAAATTTTTTTTTTTNLIYYRFQGLQKGL